MLTGLIAKGYLEPALFNKKRIHWRSRKKGFLSKGSTYSFRQWEFTKVEEVDNLLKFATKLNAYSLRMKLL